MMSSRGTNRALWRLASGRSGDWTCTKRGSSSGTLTRAKCSLLGLGVDQQDGKVEREPGDVGERVGGVNGQGGEHREDPVPEHPVQALLLTVVELVPPHDGDALVDQRGANLLLEHARMPGHQLVGDPRDLLEHLTWLQTGGGAHGQAGRDPALEAGHADHEELVEVAGEDGQVAGAFQQRQGVVFGKLQDALVELQPGDLTVQEAVLG